MDDGFLVPGKHDGMGLFPGANGKIILMRNHEMDVGATEGSPFGSRRTLLRKIDRTKLYDADPRTGIIYHAEIERTAYCTASFRKNLENFWLEDACRVEIQRNTANRYPQF